MTYLPIAAHDIARLRFARLCTILYGTTNVEPEFPIVSGGIFT